MKRLGVGMYPVSKMSVTIQFESHQVQIWVFLVMNPSAISSRKMGVGVVRRPAELHPEIAGDHATQSEALPVSHPLSTST